MPCWICYCLVYRRHQQIQQTSNSSVQKRMYYSEFFRYSFQASNAAVEVATVDNVKTLGSMDVRHSVTHYSLKPISR